jgi:hypothetical protein
LLRATSDDGEALWCNIQFTSDSTRLCRSVAEARHRVSDAARRALEGMPGGDSSGDSSGDADRKNTSQDQPTGGDSASDAPAPEDGD